MSVSPLSGTSNLLSRLALALRAGLAFRGARDYYTVFGYSRQVLPNDMVAKYYRQDVARRVVDTPCDAIWAYPPKIEGSAALMKLWEDLKRKKLLSAILQADKLCAFDSFSAIWIGTPGDPKAPASFKSVDDIAYITAYGAGAARILRWDDNSLSPRFGLPLSYQFQVDRAVAPATSQLMVEVHWTRVIHIVDNPLQGKIASVARMYPIYNLLDDILKVAGSSAETYWLAANRGIQVDVDKDMAFTPVDAAALSDEMDEYQHQLRRIIRTRGVKVNNLGSDVADPTGTFSTLMALLASATGIPQRILMGAEAGQLASAQDRANWSEYIDRRRFIFAEPYMLMPLFEYFERQGLISEGDASHATYAWPSSFHQNPLEASQTMSAKARALINLSRQSQYGTPYVGQKEGRQWLDLPPDLPADDEFPMPAALAGGGGGGAKKTGGNAASGGAGGNDGSADSGGGSQQVDTTPVHEGTADPASN